MKKHQIILYCVLITLFISVFVIYKLTDKKPKIDEYFVFEDSNNYGYSKGHGFYNLSNQNIEESGLLFKTYIDGKIMGEYYLSKINAWNLFDKDKNYVSYNGELFAHAGEVDVDVENPLCHEITSDEKSLLKSKFKIKGFDYLVSSMSCETDLNNDGKTDKIIAISNNSVTSMSDNYNIAIAIVNGKMHTLVEEYNVNNPNLYVVSYFLKIGEEKNKYIVLKSVINYDGDIESYEANYLLWKYTKGKYHQEKIKELKNK